MQRMLVEMARDFATPGSAVYDLGFSTGTTFANIHPYLDPTVRFVGFDNSKDMLDKCHSKLLESGVNRPLELSAW